MGTKIDAVKLDQADIEFAKMLKATTEALPPNEATDSSDLLYVYIVESLEFLAVALSRKNSRDIARCALRLAARAKIIAERQRDGRDTGA